jgi:RNA polymerase sigma factor (sigma-70 family)
MTRSQTAADDIVQEAFVRVFDAAALANTDDDHRRRYLYTVATNLVRRRGRTEVAYGDDRPEPTIGGLDADERLAVQQTLEALPLIERQALWLTYVERWSSREVASALGYREGSMRQVITRARRRFAELFSRRSGRD